jgi:hypothetical protein
MGVSSVIEESEIATQIGPDRLRRLHEVFRANRLAVDGYQPGSYPGRVVLVRAGLERDRFDDDRARWCTLAVGGVTTHHLAGDHYTIMQRPAVERLAEILASEIERLDLTTGEIKPR